ncbi:MAG: hypothetical protein L7V30_03165 [Gammaproteobacteria bacterium]|nr:hypothetical protein [Gammaproteobacteria bacterium]
MNIKYLVSYLGLVPFIYLNIDAYYLDLLDINFIQNLAILMCCIIFTFIGAYNWDFRVEFNLLEFYGFVPSLLSMIILTMNILDISKYYLISAMILFLLTQLLIDIFLSLRDIFPLKYPITLRVPITLILSTNLFLISKL